jgi:hypothetical protein
MIFPSGTLSASVQALTLAKGLHLVSVTAAAPQRVGDEAEITLPAIHVGPGPGVPEGQVEILSGPRNAGGWLCEMRDMLVVKVASGHAVVLLTTVRAGAQPPIAVEVARLDGKPGASLSGQGTPPPPPALAAPRALEAPARPAVAPPGLKTPSGRAALSTRIDLHIARKGDIAYVNNYWAGALGERLAIEAFAISPLEGFSPDQLEYVGYAAGGGDTGWIEGGRPCGSRGAGAALAGFAVRLKPEAAASFECEYRGSFSSGRIVGPLRDGAVCASDPGDRLEAVQLFLLRREAEPALAEPQLIAGSLDAEDPPPRLPLRRVGPRFSVFRETVE